MEFKGRADRRELFQACEHAVDWREHQKYRIERIKRIVSERINVPIASLKLCYQSKYTLELFSATGARQVYRPKGVILHEFPIHSSTSTAEFEVAWVDPWGYAHTATASFLDIRITPVTEIEYQRNIRAYRKAIERNWLDNLM